MSKKLNKKQLTRLSNWLTVAEQCYHRNAIPQAIEHCQKVLKLQPNSLIARKLLGLIALRSKQHSQAVAHFKSAISTHPNDFSLYAHLGLVYADQNENEIALRYLRKALGLNPNSFQVHNNMGALLFKTDHILEAIDAFKHALELNKNYAEAHQNLGNALIRFGHTQSAIKHFRSATEINPKATLDAQSSLLFLQAYYCMCSSEELLRQHREWDIRQRPDKTIGRWLKANDPNPERRLKIGYVSADFRQHPVATFMEPLLISHNRDNVEVFCYAQDIKHDDVTDRLQSLCDHWRVISGRSDVEVERQIRQDKIDILIDLSGHTGHNRLPVFTRRPAPIQATYLGYCASTGLEAMDYWISDSVLHPPETNECASETIHRLSRCWVCYQPPKDAPDIFQRAANSDNITFGSLNNVQKMSDELYKSWAEILHQTPGSRLLLKSKHLKYQGIKEEVLRKFESLGIDEKRVELRTSSPPPGYLSVYDEIDIALDTFPRTGGTTAADALWMGVPVITLAGERYVERLVASKLDAIGRPEWIASSQQEYIDKAVELARNPVLLKEIRSTQRQQVALSPLCESKGHAQAMEEAYRIFWKNFLEQLTG